MAIFYPRHALRIAAVLEDFTRSHTEVARAVEWVVVPRSAKLERNDIHTADRLTVVIDFQEFPFDPRMIRAASVAYFAAATNGGPVDRSDPSTLRFLGVVDTPETQLGEDSETVTFECRDYTAILLGQRATPGMAVPLERSMGDVLKDLLRTLPGESKTLLAPVLDPMGDVVEWPVVRGGGRRGARLAIQPRDTLWSIIRRVVEGAGLVCFVDLDQIVVTPPRTAGRDGALRDARRLHFVFGENLADLRIKRNAQNLTRPVVLAQYNATTGETTRSTWPAEAATPRARGRGTGRGRPQVVQRRTGGATVSQGDTSGEEFAVSGSRSAAELSSAAESIYRQRAVTEIEGSLSTHDPKVSQVRGTRGNAAEPADLWNLTTATTLFVDVGEHARAIAAATDVPSRERYLRSRGYRGEVAQALAQSWEHLDRVRPPFIVRKATLSLDANGFRAEIDFQAILTPITAGETTTELTTPDLAARGRS